MFQLGNQELRGDEAFSFLFAQLPLAEIIPTLIAEGDPHSPFHYLLLHVWMVLSGDSEFVLRYISLIPSLLLVPLLYQLGRLLHGRQLGVFAAFWLAISASQIWLAQDVRNQYMLTLLWGLLATLILVGPLQRRHSSRRRQILLWVAYIILAALTVYSHYFGLFILLGAWWLFVVVEKRPLATNHRLGAGRICRLAFVFAVDRRHLADVACCGAVK